MSSLLLPASDLGELATPLLVFGGPYSNLEATRALRRVADALKIPPEQCLCTGDVVAYCADPVDTVREIRDWGIPVVMGNCEESLAEGATDCGCGFTEGTVCDRLSQQWFNYASARIEEDDRRWMAGLPRRLLFSVNGLRVMVIHGGVRQINRFLFASQSDADFHEELAGVQADIILAGHCGIPFTRRIGSQLWHNAGVIGLPANDGSSDTWYSLIESAGLGQLRITYRHLKYDVATAANKMADAELTGGYNEALITGLWPSLDVLPEQEKRATGQPIRFAEVLWQAPVSLQHNLW